MKRKSIFTIFSTIILLIGITTSAGANPKTPTIVVDGKILYCDVAPFMKDNRVMIPLRPIFDALGGDLFWNATEKRVTGFKGAHSINLVIGQKTAVISGGKTVNLDVAASEVKGRTFVPLRFVSESLGSSVNWDNSKSVASITSSKVSEVKEIADLITPSVVLVVADVGNGNYSQGSGFFFNLDNSQYIITNSHVISGAKSVQVKTYDGTVHDATITQDDSVLDLAKLTLNDSNHNSIQWYNSEDVVSVGDQCIAIGNPLDLENSVTTGVISAKRPDATEDLFQISAPITHGSSGGALLDKNGCIIGITSAGIEKFQGANFAIPIDYVFKMQNRPSSTSSDASNASDSAMTADGFKNYLITKYGSMTMDGYQIHSNAISKLDGQMVYALVVDAQNATNLLQIEVAGNKADIESWLKTMGQDANNYFPNDQVSIGIMFRFHVDKKLSSFPNATYLNDPEGGYFMQNVYCIIGVQNGKYQIEWRPNG